MNSRDHILAAINAIPTEEAPLLPVFPFEVWFEDTSVQFRETLKFIGAEVVETVDMLEVERLIRQQYSGTERIMTNEPSFYSFASAVAKDIEPASLEDVDIAILKASLAVAENGAIWLKEEDLVCRVLPFICQHLVLIIKRDDVVALMSDAYRIIEGAEYDYGSFIAGPSKTADIEQSLVLGAHGARSLKVFII